MVRAQAVQFLYLRVHDGAKFSHHWAHYMAQTFHQNGGYLNRGIYFLQSCSCPVVVPTFPPACFACPLCWCPLFMQEHKPVAFQSFPWQVEADEHMTMELQFELIELGLLAGLEDDEELRENAEYTPMAEEEEEVRKAFFSGWYVSLCCSCCGQLTKCFRGADGRQRRWRGNIARPAVWKYRQTNITEYFKPTGEEPTARVGTRLFWRGKDPKPKKYSQKLLDSWVMHLEYEEYLANIFYHWSDRFKFVRKESRPGGSFHTLCITRRMTCPW
jgi:hypothetical protein